MAVTLYWDGLGDVPAEVEPSVVAIGVFDGMHAGHMAVLERAVAIARDGGLQAVALTFYPHPRTVVGPTPTPVPLLTTPRQRVALMGNAGMDAVLVLHFDLDLAAMSAEDFLQDILLDTLRAKVIVAGEDFHFGHRRRGSVTLMRELAPSRGFEVEAVPLLADADGESPDAAPPVSSSLIRQLIAEGRVERARHILGRPYRIEGPVVHGDSRGRELGYPTANLGEIDGLAIPADGVYGGWLLRDPWGPDPVRMAAAISVGTNPTFEGIETRVEAYVIGRTDLDLYDEVVALDFEIFERGQITFTTIEDLIIQIGHDVAAISSRLVR